jgi:hypothetical protein
MSSLSGDSPNDPHAVRRRILRVAGAVVALTGPGGTSLG